MTMHAYGALKGRPHVVRTVKPLFRLPRGSTLLSLRQRVEFSSLLACTAVHEQRIIGQPEERMKRGGCLGSSVLNPSHWPLLCRWEGQGELVQLQLPSATFEFFAQAKTGTDHRIKKQLLSQGVARAVRPLQHPRCARNLSTPSFEALAGKRLVASLLGHSRLVALCSLVPFTDRPLGPLTSSSTTPSSVWV